MRDPVDLPAREKGETADHYLNRIQEYEKIKRIALKEAERADKRIRSAVERVIIDKAVREALRPVKKGRTIRFYTVPKGRALWALGPLAPVYILLSILFQDLTDMDNRFKRGISVLKEKYR